MIRWFGLLGCSVRASVSCHIWCGSVWSRLGCNAMYNAIGGIYNAVSMVKLIVYIQYENGTLHSLLYNVIVTFFVILFFGSRLPSVSVHLYDSTRLPRPRITNGLDMAECT